VAYSTQADILDRISSSVLNSIADKDGDGSADSDVVSRAIADADSLIDSYVGVRHSVPLSTVPTVVRSCSVALAVYNLFVANPHASVPESWAEERKQWMSWLRDVSKGVVSLGEDDPDGSPPDTHAPEMAGSNPDRLFTRDDLDDY